MKDQQVAKTIALFGFVSMASALAYGFLIGDFFSDGAELLSNPWGIVSIVDLYTGFALFSGWIFFRERSWTRRGFWILGVMILGFFAASLYVFLALQASNGDWKKFLLGTHFE